MKYRGGKRWVRSISGFLAERERGANEKLKWTIVRGDGTPFPQSQSWTTYGERNMAYSRVAESLWRHSSPSHAPTLIITLQLIPPFRILLRFSKSPGICVRDRLFLLRVNITRSTLVIPIRDDKHRIVFRLCPSAQICRNINGELARASTKMRIYNYYIYICVSLRVFVFGY